jgi:ParB family chromosome partitioning protein
MNAATLINQTSGAVEYYTPVEIIEAATECMGFIHLDPASCETANMIVRAGHYFTKADDGLPRSWEAETVWLNHPFGRGLNEKWIGKLINQWLLKNFTQACCITYACTSENWFRPLLSFPQCFIHGRTNYRLPSGEIFKGNTKGSVVTYLGPNVRRFAQSFRNIGTVKTVYSL